MIEARAVPKGRPRFTKSGHAYTPPATKAWEDQVAWKWRSMHRFAEPFLGAISVRMIFIGKRLLRGDLDNYVKAVSDALNGLAWKDDRQIIELRACKHKGDRDEVWVAVTEEGP